MRNSQDDLSAAVNLINAGKIREIKNARIGAPIRWIASSMQARAIADIEYMLDSGLLISRNPLYDGNTDTLIYEYKANPNYSAYCAAFISTEDAKISANLVVELISRATDPALVATSAHAFTPALTGVLATSFSLKRVTEMSTCVISTVIATAAFCAMAKNSNVVVEKTHGVAADVAIAKLQEKNNTLKEYNTALVKALQRIRAND